MTKVATVHVADGMLKHWRERAHVDRAIAADRIGHPDSDLAAWEDGRADPPLSTLRTLATLYAVPLSAFLLSKAKPEPAPPVDNRALAGILNPETNATLARALNRAIGLQVLADELHSAMDIEPFMVTAQENVAAELLAAQERAALGISVGAQLNWATDGEALRKWRLAVERRGIYVLQMPLRDTDVRAFSIRGDPPVIVLDRSDWVRARIFSLAHELGHVVSGGSGICVPMSSRATGVERWCNEFADALLAPREAFVADSDVKRIAGGEPVTDVVLKRIGNRFKVSPAVVWYRLMQTKAINSATFNAAWDNWSHWRPPPDEGGGASPTPERIVRDYGVTFPNLLLQATRKGLMANLDASQYLDVRPEAMPAIEREIASRLAA